MSDGLFTKVQDEEIGSIQRGVMEFEEAVAVSSSCCLHITFLVCMTKDKVKMVPAADDPNSKIKNVWSGK